MTTDDPFASPPGDRTLVIPNPGARAARPAPAPSTGAGSARIELAALDWGAGLNPLVAAANPLLGLVPHLRQAHHPDPAALRDTLARAVQAFETKAREAGVLNEHVIGARYALCTFLDETAANTPWGEKLWAQRSLLVQFHNEAWGGEKFFQLLGKLAEQPATHRNLLELFYIILALGFEGRYRVLQNGRAQLDAVRERLAQMIIKERGEPTRELSPHWQTLATNARPLRDSVPIWAVAAIAALLLATLYLASSYAVNRHSDPAFAQILGLRVPPDARRAGELARRTGSARQGAGPSPAFSRCRDPRGPGDGARPAGPQRRADPGRWPVRAGERNPVAQGQGPDGPYRHRGRKGQGQRAGARPFGQSPDPQRPLPVQLAPVASACRFGGCCAGAGTWRATYRNRGAGRERACRIQRYAGRAGKEPPCRDHCVSGCGQLSAAAPSSIQGYT